MAGWPEWLSRMQYLQKCKFAPGLPLQGMSFPEQWCNVKVQPYGDYRPTQLKSLKKIMKDHKDSKIHISSEKVCSERDIMPNMTRELKKNMKQLSEFSKLLTH